MANDENADGRGEYGDRAYDGYEMGDAEFGGFDRASAPTRNFIRHVI